MEIRFAVRGDFERCLELSRNFKQTRDFKCFAYRWGWGKGKLLVAEEDGELWGFQFFNVCANLPYTRMYYTCVDPTRHGQGIGGKFLDTVIQLSVAAGKEEIKLTVETYNEQAIKFYKGFGILPTCFNKRGDYVYRVSLRSGKKCVEDFVKEKFRTTRAKKGARVLHRLKQYRDKGIYTMCGRPDLSKKYDPEEIAFTTAWGTNMTGKSTLAKQMIERSKFIEVFDPFFTLLDDGVVLVGTYPADIRAGGMDSTMGATSFVYAVRLLRELWQMRDIRILFGEGMQIQARRGIIRRYTENHTAYKRKVVIFRCICSLDTVGDRLYASKGKRVADYSRGGFHIIRKYNEIERILSDVDPEIFEVVDFDTEHRDIAAMMEEFGEVVML